MDENTKVDLEVLRLRSLRTFRARMPRGSVLVLPVVRGRGEEVEWQIRAHLKGVSGPLNVDERVVAELGGPPELLNATLALQAALQEKFPRMEPEIVRELQALVDEPAGALEAGDQKPEGLRMLPEGAERMDPDQRERRKRETAPL